MGEQQPLFAGNRGCGKRDKPAAVVDIVARRGDQTAWRKVIVRIDGFETKPKNRSHIASVGARMGEAEDTRKARKRVKLAIFEAVGINATWTHKVTTKVKGIYVTGDVTEGCHRPAPARVVVTRLSSNAGTSNEMDRGAVWEALKSTWDGIADAFGLASDRDLQREGDVAQAKCKPGTKGIVIELFFSTEAR